jgi:Mycotoxin biosynthesis protein UstYa
MFKIFSRAKYQPVEETEDSKALISDSSSIESNPYTPPARKGLSVFLAVAIVLVSSLFTSLLGVWVGRHFPGNLDSVCTTHTSKYSEFTPFSNSQQPSYMRLIQWGNLAPIIEDVEITYKPHIFNGSFYKPNIYRGDPSPEVDAAWDALGAECTCLRHKMVLSTTDVVRIANSGNSCRQLPPDSCKRWREGRPDKAGSCDDQREIRRRVLWNCGGSSPLALLGTFPSLVYPHRTSL